MLYFVNYRTSILGVDFATIGGRLFMNFQGLMIYQNACFTQEKKRIVSVYKFTISGQKIEDGKNYKAECICRVMSKDEITDFTREQGLKKETVKVKKERVK